MTHRLRAFAGCGGAAATHESILDYFRTLPAASTRRTRKSDVQVVYRTLTLAGLIPHDPSAAIPRMRAARWSPRPLTDDEIDELMRHAPDELRDMLTLALYAGLRAQEIAELRAEQLELVGGRWTLRVLGKGDVEATLPAHPKVVEIMLEHTGRVFPGATANSVSHKAIYLFKKLGIQGGIHRCRHTFATRAMVASGESLLVVRDLLRHASVSTTQVYTQLSDGRLWETMAKIA